MAILTLFFFATALLYASVGFGGGSTYSALLILNDIDYRILPAIALICNIAVVTGGIWRFGVEGYLRPQRLAPLFAASVPAAWLGGMLPVPETVFVSILAAVLFASGLYLLLSRERHGEPDVALPLPLVTGAAIGGVLGLVAGIVGIGGGIFLAPVLYHLRWGSPREIAAASSLFILVNSIAGLAGQTTKIVDAGLVAPIAPYWPLLPAVVLGGQIGSLLGSRLLPKPVVRRGTALLILFVACRLALRLLAPD